MTGKKLPKKLNLKDIDHEQVKFATFGNRRPQQSIAAKVRIEIKTIEADVRLIVATVVNYLTRFSLINTIVGPIIAGSGYMHKHGNSLNKMVYDPHEMNNERLLLKYDETIRDQIQSNFIEKVCPEMDQVGIIHYLPHHEVITPDKATTKLRIVYDASSHQKGRKGLNDEYFSLHFRMMEIVIIADTEKAFLQLELLLSERNCTRFLWLKDIRGQAVEENIEDEIKKNLYVDNIVVSINGTDEALLKYQEMKIIFNDASMNKKKISWDQLISMEDQETWKNLICAWPIHVKEIPHVAMDPSEPTKIYVFSDASPVAYAVSVYVIQENEASLVFAKSRIAPIKGMTIPKLELLAVLIGVRAAQFVIKQIELENIKVALWSDSKCVHWIHNHSRLLPKFV
uniref:RT_RNaseH_2 domain-containing protein n=1 Tax=Loa loa TaxID=7209 RepID=A0A1I7V878_LOALO